MKKVKVTFWLLGFGCGIALAGMIGTLLTLKIDVLVQQSNITENKGGDEIGQESQKDTNRQGIEEKGIDRVLGEIHQDSLSSDQGSESDEGESVENDQKSIIDTQEESVENYREVFIPNNSVASEICVILEEADIVESGADFLSYIKAHKKQTRLKGGTFNLPVHADYETLLALLLV